MSKLKELSIFFPAYNEEQNIRKLVESSFSTFYKYASNFEVIIIDDGSKDNTAAIVKDLQKKYSNLVLVSQENRGYGGALKTGFASARYEWIFFSDADLQFNLDDFSKFICYAKNYEVIVGYRKRRSEGFKRDIIAKLLKLWNFFILGFPFYLKDIDCAFKLIHKNVLASISPLYSDGAMVSTEILLKIIKNGYSIKQVPVDHFNRTAGSSTGSNLGVITKAIKETFALKKMLKNTSQVSA